MWQKKLVLQKVFWQKRQLFGRKFKVAELVNRPKWFFFKLSDSARRQSSFFHLEEIRFIETIFSRKWKRQNNFCPKRSIECCLCRKLSFLYFLLNIFQFFFQFFSIFCQLIKSAFWQLAEHSYRMTLSAFLSIVLNSEFTNRTFPSNDVFSAR